MTPVVVAIPDANALIDLKKVRVAIQWELLRGLEVLVEMGAICVPSHVIREVADVYHPDAPGAWAKGIERKQQYELEADPRYVQQVMGGAPEILDQYADTEQADPYVVAMAPQFKAEGRDCVVATRDKKDRPDQISPVTACQRLGIPHTAIEDYLDDIQEHFDAGLAGKAAADIRKNL